MAMAIVIGTNNPETLDAADGATSGNDVIYGLGGDDALKGGEGADHLDGGEGHDTARYSDSTVGVFVDLGTGLGYGGTAEGDTLTSIEYLYGSVHDDTFIGDDNFNWLQGEEGDDSLKGGGGDDTLVGDGWLSTDRPPGDDTLKGGGGGDYLNGGQGSDTAAYDDSPAGVTVSLTTRLASGGDAEGDSWSSIENLTGSSHADDLDGDDGANELRGLGGNDSLNGWGGADSLYGGDDHDTLKGGGGADVLDGGLGSDTVSYTGSQGVTVSLIGNTASGGDAEGDRLYGIENLTGSTHADWLEGNNSVNVLDGSDGDDTLMGFGGADSLNGGAHNDRLNGGGGADALDGGSGSDTATYIDSDEGVTVSLIGNTAAFGDAAGDTFISIENLTGSNYGDNLEGDDGANVLNGMSGNDTLEGGSGADILNGGAGGDTASYDHSSAGVIVSLLADTAAGGDAAGDDLNSIEHLVGSAHADVLSGNNNGNVIGGGDGNNWLYGYGGDDGLAGGDDTDMLFGMEGVDLLKGGGGADTLVGGSGGDTMLGGTGDDTYFADDAADVVLEYAGEGTFDRVRTSATYSLTAGSEVEVLETSSFFGTTIIDLFGNEFDNTITGNATSNVLAGSPVSDSGGFDGLDTLTGGGLGDTFVWNTTAETGVAGNEADIITDFNRVEDDVIAINNIDADETVAGNQAFTFIGTGAFTAPGQVNFFTTASDTFIQMNVDGDNFAEATIHLLGVHNVDASFFVL
jgi:Ca2+-binding RTX toxin-like protein